MSDQDTTKVKAGGWTDKERLTYLFALIDSSNVKFDYATTPRPVGRSVIACQRMVERLKGTLKTELELLKGGNPIEEGTPKKATPKKPVTPRKRKSQTEGDEVSGEGATPKKRGRAKKIATPEAQVEDDEETFTVKEEIKDDEGEEEV